MYKINKFNRIRSLSTFLLGLFIYIYSPSVYGYSNTYAYFPMGDPDYIHGSGYLQCKVNDNDGSMDLKNCITVTDFSKFGAPENPEGLAFFSDFAYFVNSSIFNEYYTKCYAGAPNGVINPKTCVDITPTGIENLGMLHAIAFNWGYAYILGGNGYMQCRLSIDLAIDPNSCVTHNLSANLLDNPRDIVFNGQYVYFVNWDSYTQCYVNNQGIEPATCFRHTFPEISPDEHGSSKWWHISLNFAGKYAYFTRTMNRDYSYAKGYIQCRVNYDGIDTNTCVFKDLPILHMGSAQVVFHERYAYFIDTNVTKCNIDYNGIIDPSSCVVLFDQNVVPYPHKMTFYKLL